MYDINLSTGDFENNRKAVKARSDKLSHKNLKQQRKGD